MEGEVRGREQRATERKERKRKWERSAYEDMSTRGRKVEVCEPPFIFQRHHTLVPSFDGGMRIKLSMKSWSIKTKLRTQSKVLKKASHIPGGAPCWGQVRVEIRGKGMCCTAKAEKYEVKGRRPG